MTEQTAGRALEPFPTADVFLFDTPLYREFRVTRPDDRKRLSELMVYRGKRQMICPVCREFTVLAGDHQPVSSTFDPFQLRMFDVGVRCEFKQHEKLLFSFRSSGSVIVKIGQWPSTADFVLPRLQHLRRELDPRPSADLARAVGLFSHGIGAGSVVYLRRVFEGLISDERDAEFANDPDGLADFNRLRMDEKIQRLGERLPEFLVRNRGIYGILSKGVHELSEDECLALFPVLQSGIEEILEAHLEQRRRAKRASDAANAIAQLQGKLKAQDTSEE